MQQNNQLIIYPTYTKVTLYIDNYNTSVNINNADIKTVFVTDKDGKSVPFIYKEKTIDDVLDFNPKFKNITVTKGTQTYHGTLYKYDHNSITILSDNNKLNKIINYDNASISVNFINKDSVIMFKIDNDLNNSDDKLDKIIEDNEKKVNNEKNNTYTLPFKVQYITENIYWSCEGIGLLNNKDTECNDQILCFNINLDIILRAYITNNAFSGKFDIFLGFSNYEYINNLDFFERKAKNLSLIREKNIKNDKYEDEHYIYHLGIKDLKMNLNIFDYKNITCEAMKTYFYIINDANKTYLGYIIKEIENLPTCNIQFFDYSNKNIGRLYGNIHLSRISKSKNVKIIFDMQSLSLNTSSDIHYQKNKNGIIESEKIELLCENKNDHNIILAIYHNLDKTINKNNIKFEPKIDDNNITIDNLKDLKFFIVVKHNSIKKQKLVISYPK